MLQLFKLQPMPCSMVSPKKEKKRTAWRSRLSPFLAALLALVFCASCSNNVGPSNAGPSSSQPEAEGTALFSFPLDSEVTVTGMNREVENGEFVTEKLDEDAAVELLEKLNGFRYTSREKVGDFTADTNILEITPPGKEPVGILLGINDLRYSDGYLYQSATGGYFPPRWTARVLNGVILPDREEILAQDTSRSAAGKPVFTWDPETVTGAQIRDEDYPDAPRTLEGDELNNLVTHLAGTKYGYTEEATEGVHQGLIQANLTFSDGSQSGWFGLHELFIIFPGEKSYWRDMSDEAPHTIGLSNFWLFDLMYPEADG